MAKIVFGAIVADARKKISGNVFSKSRFGAYIRKKTSPTQPRTNAQRTVRANFTSLSKSFATTLTGTQVAAWNSFASLHPVKDRFGATQHLTGLQWYQRLNRALHTIAIAAIATPPATLSTADLGGLTATQAATTPFHISVSTTNAPATGEYLVVFATAPFDTGKSIPGRTFRLIGTFIGTTTQPIDIQTLYDAKFGGVASGQKIFFQVFNVQSTTGAKGTPYQASVVTTNPA